MQNSGTAVTGMSHPAGSGSCCPPARPGQHLYGSPATSQPLGRVHVPCDSGLNGTHGLPHPGHFGTRSLSEPSRTGHPDHSSGQVGTQEHVTQCRTATALLSSLAPVGMGSGAPIQESRLFSRWWRCVGCGHGLYWTKARGTGG